MRGASECTIGEFAAGLRRGCRSAPRPGESRAKALCARANEARSGGGDTITAECRALDVTWPPAARRTIHGV